MSNNVEKHLKWLRNFEREIKIEKYRKIYKEDLPIAPWRVSKIDVRTRPYRGMKGRRKYRRSNLNCGLDPSLAINDCEAFKQYVELTALIIADLRQQRDILLKELKCLKQNSSTL